MLSEEKKEIKLVDIIKKYVDYRVLFDIIFVVCDLDYPYIHNLKSRGG